MKTIFFMWILLSPIILLSQTRRDSLFLDNKVTKIVAILDSSVYTRYESTNGEDELVSDFLACTYQLKGKMLGSGKILYPVEIYVCNNIFFNKIRLKHPKYSVYYLFINKNKVKPYFIEGDTADEVLENIEYLIKDKKLDK
jgi:hypothetical protein